MKLAILALGLALSCPLAAAAPDGLKASLHRGPGIHRIEIRASEPGWSFRGDKASGVHVVDRKDGSATVLVMDHVLASGDMTLVMEKDGEIRRVRLNARG